MSGIATTDVPYWPRLEAVVRGDGSAEVTINGTSYPVRTADVDTARQAVLALVIEHTAVPLGRPVRLDTVDPDGQHWQLIVHPNGHVDDVPPVDRRARRRTHARDERVGSKPRL